MKNDIFEFNHIDSLLSEDEVKTLKEFYNYYHKKFLCFKKTFKHFKIIDESMYYHLWNFTGNNRNNIRWFNIEPNSSWCNQWIWNTSHKFLKNEKLQKENRNDENSFYFI